MLGREVVREVTRLRGPGQHFISWWRPEQDFLDIDLVDRFVENCASDEEIGGFDLLGMEEMWDRLLKVAPDRIKQDTLGAQKFILWQKEGGEKVECPLAPETLMDIFDTETKHSYID